MSALNKIISECLGDDCLFGATATYKNPYDPLLFAVLSYLSLVWPTAVLWTPGADRVFPIHELDRAARAWPHAVLQCLHRVYAATRRHSVELPFDSKDSVEAPTFMLQVEHQVGKEQTTTSCSLQAPSDSMLRLLWDKLVLSGVLDLGPCYRGMPLLGLMRMLHAFDAVNYRDSGPVDLLQKIPTGALMAVAKQVFKEHDVYPGHQVMAGVLLAAVCHGPSDD